MGYTGLRMKTLPALTVGRQQEITMRECDGSGVITLASLYPGDYNCVPCPGCEVCVEQNKEDALLQAIKKLLDDPEWTMKTIKRIEREMRTGRKG